jgi:DNA-directed RNA polymerase specialized sigma24 family protein
MSPENEQLLVEEIVPRIRGSVSNAVPQVGADDVAELVQDGIAIAATLLVSAEARGKKVSAGNISYYATKLVRQGRRSTGQSTTDVMSPRTQMVARCRVVSLEEPVKYEEGNEEPLALGEVLACEAEDPSATGARNLDWRAFIETLDELARTILQCLADERPLLEVAHATGVSRSTIQTHKNRLTAALQAFMGPELMQELQCSPQWRVNIRAAREKMACRYERRPA